MNQSYPAAAEQVIYTELRAWFKKKRVNGLQADDGNTGTIGNQCLVTIQPIAVWTRQKLCVYEKLMEMCHMTEENWRLVCATVGDTTISYLWSSSER